MFSVEKKGHGRRWSPGVNKCKSCGKHDGCKQPICVNDNGHAKSFSNVCKAVNYLSNKKRLIVAAVGLGTCKELFSCEFLH